MAHTRLDETQIKELFKQAFVELLQERKDLFYELVAEIIEDFALLRAIKEGEDTATVGREEVFRVLERVP
jgi:spore coat polysaccharide biosynthesis protein SpsF (cytidylyltransferase family)